MTAFRTTYVACLLIVLAACAAVTPTEEVVPTEVPASVHPAPPELFVVSQLQRFAPTGTGDLFDAGQRVRRSRAMGFSGLRLGFEWPDLEPRPGLHQWARQDSLVALATGQGLKIYGMVGYTPPWARPARTNRSHRPMIGGSAARGDTAFARFAAALARRYRGRVDGWEIWNEPNLPRFWKHVERGGDRGPDPSDYLSLFRLVRDSVLAANGRATVITAGLAPGPTARRRSREGDADEAVRYPAHVFLRDLLDMGLDADHIGLHPYTREPLRWTHGRGVRGFRNPVLDSVVAVLDTFGRRDARIWVTEWGVNLDDEYTEDVQRVWFARGLELLLCHPRVERVTVYALTDGRLFRRYALLRSDGTPTVGGRTLRATLDGWSGCGGQEVYPDTLPRPH